MKRKLFLHLLLILIVITPSLLNGQNFDAVTYFNPLNKENRLTLFIMNEEQIVFCLSFGANSGVEAISGRVGLMVEEEDNKNDMEYLSNGIKLPVPYESDMLCRVEFIIDTTDFSKIFLASHYCNEGKYKPYIKDSITMLLDSTSNFLCLEKLKGKTIFHHYLNQSHEVIKDGCIYKYKIIQEITDELHFEFECRNIKTQKLIKRLKGTTKSSNFGYEEMDIPVYKKRGDPKSGVDYYEASGVSCYDWYDGKGRVISFKFDPSDYYLLITEYHEKNKKFKPFWNTNEAIRKTE